MNTPSSSKRQTAMKHNTWSTKRFSDAKKSKSILTQSHVHYSTPAARHVRYGSLSRKLLNFKSTCVLNLVNAQWTTDEPSGMEPNWPSTMQAASLSMSWMHSVTRSKNSGARQPDFLQCFHTEGGSFIRSWHGHPRTQPSSSNKRLVTHMTAVHSLSIKSDLTAWEIDLSASQHFPFQCNGSSFSEARWRHGKNF